MNHNISKSNVSLGTNIGKITKIDLKPTEATFTISNGDCVLQAGNTKYADIYNLLLNAYFCSKGVSVEINIVNGQNIISSATIFDGL
ncbi:hypothetical protein [Photorhabdus hainanensis]|uniref:hypothetical protein n=1 Tax=Photorhabdus TaxID=29487 RepID=UPI001BD57578|nr:hypothetical protein [Photorhabdus hainanensis]MBS9431904.1 hypothetical protein [Photorhabdus hainanensis]